MANKIDKVVWIIDTIRRARKISLADIQRKWIRYEIDEGNELPDRTFHKLKATAKERYNVEIKSEKKKGYPYYIANPEIFDNGSVESWILGNMMLSNSMMQYQSLMPRVQFEYVPSAQKHLTTVFDAMGESRQLEFDYFKYNSEEFHPHVIAPYFLKLFHQRWYVAGWEVNQKMIKVFCLDRIHAPSILDATFEMPEDIKIENVFEGRYGVFSADPKEPIEHIRLKFTPFMAHYISALPLHHTQIREVTNDGSDIFAYDMCIDPELVNALLSYGPEVEVLAPASLRDIMREKIAKMTDIYAKPKRKESKK